MAFIREGHSGGRILAHSDGDMIREGVAGWRMDQERRCGGGAIAYVDGDFIRDPLGGSVMAVIDGNYIRTRGSGEVLFYIDGDATDMEKAALAMAVMPRVL